MPKFKVSDLVKDLPKPAKTKIYLLMTAGVMGILLSLISIISLIRFKRQRTHSVKVAPHPEHAVPREAASYAFPYEIRDISVQLMDRAGVRTGHAQFSLALDCPSEEAKHHMTLNRAKLLDSIFEVISQFYIEDFQSGNGLSDFKAALKKNYDDYFGPHSPREISIGDWIFN